MHLINRAGGSLGRSQVCNLACGSTATSASPTRCSKPGSNRLFARNGWLSIGRKRPMPHESHFFVAGYFYYYGHWYAAQCIDELAGSRAAPLPGPSGPHALAAAREGRQLVGLSVLQLPPAIRHGDGGDVAGALPKGNLARRCLAQTLVANGRRQ